MSFSPTETEKKRIERKVLAKVKPMIQRGAKYGLNKIVNRRMIKTAINESLKGCNAFDLAIILSGKYNNRFCKKCGECCRRNDPILINMNDIMNLGAFLGVEAQLIIGNYTKQLKDGNLSLRVPCPFLQKNNLCSVYPARPNVCRAFPIIPSKEIENAITLGAYGYCEFVWNFVAYKAFRLLLIKLIETMFPNEYQEYMKLLEAHLAVIPKDQEGQILFAKRLMEGT